MTLLLVQSSSSMDQATAAAATILTRLATLWLSRSPSAWWPMYAAADCAGRHAIDTAPDPGPMPTLPPDRAAA